MSFGTEPFGTIPFGTFVEEAAAGHDLIVDNANAQAAIDDVVVTQVQNLSGSNADAQAGADAPGISQTHNLVVRDASSVTAIDAVAVNTGGLGNVLNPSLRDVSVVRTIRNLTEVRELRSIAA